MTRGHEAPARARWRDAVVPGARPLAVAALGLALGLGTTMALVGRGWDPEAVEVGPWRGHPRVGTPAANPYVRAELARSGEMPMAANEGIALTAITDDTGYRLLRTCAYRVSGGPLAARLWTLTAADESGRPMDNSAHRFAFTSVDVIRDLGGQFAIEVAAEARPGNWLPVGGRGALTLSLRLYDTPLAQNAGALAEAALPSIERRACAPPPSGQASPSGGAP